MPGHETLIVGGGIAGLSCALRLARMGRSICLAEQLRPPIDKVCGEGILPFGVDLLAELGLREKVRDAGAPFYGLRYARGSQVAEGSYGEGRFGVGIERFKLDHILREACTAAGVRIMSGRKIRSGDKVPFEHIIAADGIKSGWARAIGRQVLFSDRVGFRFRLEVKPPDRVAVHFFRGFEVYFTPTGSKALSVAILADRSRFGLPAGHLRDVLITRFREHFPDFRDHEIGSLASRAPIASKPYGEMPNLILLGDAAGAFDPISGAGMSFALLCGKIAADTLGDPAAYWRRLKPHQRALGLSTDLCLFFRGGSWLTRLMLRQLAGAPAAFDRILELHNGIDHPFKLELGHVMRLLNPLSVKI